MTTSGLLNDNCPLPRTPPSRIGTVITDNPSKPWYNYVLVLIQQLLQLVLRMYPELLKLFHVISAM